MKWTLLFIYGGMGLFTLLLSLSLPKHSDDGKTHLSWLTWNGVERIRQAEGFNKLNPDCRLTIDPDNGGVTKVVVQCSAGMGGDIIGGVNPRNIQTYVDAGILRDLTEDARKMGFGLDTLPKGMHPFVQLKVLDKNGNITKRQFVYPLNIGHRYIIYNKDIFDKYRVPYLPKDLTWEKYIEIAKKLTIYKNKDDKIPEIFGAQGALLDVIIWEKGGRAMNKDGTKCLLNSKEVVDSLCFLHDLIYKHKVEPTATMSAGVTTSDGKRSAYSWLCDNRLAIGFGARWYLMVMRPYFKNRRKEMEAWKKEHPGEEYKGPKPYRFGACLVPRFKDGPRYTLANGRGAGINASSPNAEKALKFLQYAASKEYAEQIIEIADCKPPNKNFHKKELFYSKEYPEEKEIHDISVESIKYGRMDELSPFIDNTIVARQIKDLEAKVRSNKDLTRDGIQELADYSAEKINHRIAENISKNKRLQLFYKKVLEQGGEPALYYNSGKEKEK